MKKLPPAPSLPGQGNARNLVEQGGHEACPCCGSVWKGGMPWSDKVLTPLELSEATGLTQQNITTRIRSGTIAAYLAVGAGGRNKYLIPIFEAQRIQAEDPNRKAEEVKRG